MFRFAARAAARAVRASAPRATAAGLAALSFVGAVAVCTPSPPAGHPDAANTPPLPALSSTEFRGFRLLRNEAVTPNTRRLTFALPKEGDELGVLTAGCVYVQGAGLDDAGAWEGGRGGYPPVHAVFALTHPPPRPGKPYVRPYTPTSPPHARGTFELVVKGYEGGRVSKWLTSLSPGAVVQMKGPGTQFLLARNAWPAAGFLVGGTGITPAYQVISSMLADPRDTTEIRLLYASHTPADIILRPELDALAATHPNFKVTYVVSGAGGGEWDGPVGRIDKGMIAAVLPPPGGGNRVLVCGPPSFMKALCGEKKNYREQGPVEGALRELHYTEADVFKF